MLVEIQYYLQLLRKYKQISIDHNHNYMMLAQQFDLIPGSKISREIDIMFWLENDAMGVYLQSEYGVDCFAELDEDQTEKFEESYPEFSKDFSNLGDLVYDVIQIINRMNVDQKKALLDY